jgi:hypothetical protein
MRKIKNLFVEWQLGELNIPKVYLIRVRYVKLDGVEETCLKLGFTKRPLHIRIVEFLGKMSKSTGFNIKDYEVLSVLNTPSHSKMEHFLHKNISHLHFHRTAEVTMKFKGSKEVLHDNEANISKLQYLGLQLLHESIIGSYNARFNTRSTPYPDFNLV